MALLAVRDLAVRFPSATVVDGISFEVDAGETVALVGESGCGKTVTALAILGLLPPSAVRVRGSVRLDGQKLLGADVHALRGREIAMVFQDPMTALHPVLTVGRQVAEVLEHHFRLDRRAAMAEAVSLLDAVGIPAASRRARDYPHQLSGGMRQRVMIAMALACRPRLVIADEPTTALDVTIQAQILELLRALVTARGTALLLITHDLSVVAGTCERVHVMYSGLLVESAASRDLFSAPRHPYTAGLLASVPRLDRPRSVPLRPIPGSPRNTLPWAAACAFAPRCPNRIRLCTERAPVMSGGVRCFNPVGVSEPSR